jgi:hypothetical protein
MLLSFPILDTCPAHSILLTVLTLKIMGEDYRSWSSWLWSFFHTPLTSPLLGPNILLNTIFSSTPYSQTPSAYVPPSI